MPKLNPLPRVGHKLQSKPITNVMKIAEGTLHEEFQYSVAKDLGRSPIKQHGGLNVSAFVRPKNGINPQQENV